MVETKAILKKVGVDWMRELRSGWEMGEVKQDDERGRSRGLGRQRAGI